MTGIIGLLYKDALAELIGRAEAQELPEEVVRALARVFEHPQKLFFWEPNDGLASGISAPNEPVGLQASDLLVKLVLAVRALDWEVVIVAGADA